MKRIKNLVHSALGLLVGHPLVATAAWPTKAGCPLEPGQAVGLRALLSNVNDSFNSIANLLGGSAYVAGIAFTVGGIMKLKQHRDNPAQVPIATPITYIFIGAMLVFLPSTIMLTRASIFTTTESEGGSIQSLYQQQRSSNFPGSIEPSDC